MRARAERRVQPGAAQAGQRPVVPGRGARAGRRARSARGPTSDRKAGAARRRDGARSPTCGPGYDVVVCEGAGSPAEINLRATDIANMGLAQAADLPVVVVGDIDRGGVLAHLFGTVAVLDAEDQAPDRRVRRSTSSAATRPCSRPGLDQLRALTGRPTFGVVPWADRLWLDAEDSLSAVADGVLGRPAPPHGTQWLRVAVVRLPRISNATDVEALACEPGVAVRYVTEPSRLAGADLVVLPGLEGDRVRPGVAAAHRARRRGGARTRGPGGRCWGSAAATRCWGGASPTRTASRAAIGATGLGLLDLEVEFAAGQGAWPRPAGDGAGASRCAATRSTTAGSSGDPGVRRRRSPARAPTAAPCSARTGTACWRTTGSAGPCWRASRRRPAAPGSAPRPTRRSPRSARRSSTCSATSSRRTSTPPRWSMSSVTAPARTCRSSRPSLAGSAP